MKFFVFSASFLRDFVNRCRHVRSNFRLQKWSHSSAVERTAAVRLVPGSIPGGSLLLLQLEVMNLR